MTQQKPMRVKVPRELKLRNLSVTDAKVIPGGFVRVTVDGDDLHDFESTGPTDHCKLMIERGGEFEGRHYTPLPVGEGKIAFDIVVHGDGLIGSWAETLPIGQSVRLGGPRSSLEFPVGAEQLVLVGDASAFPPMRRWLNARPTSLPTTIILHGEGTEYFDDVADMETVEVINVPFGPDGTDLEDAVRSVELAVGTYVWAAGEAATLIPIRRWLKGESGLESTSYKIDGYWKRGVADRDHHEPIDPEDNAS